MSKFRSWKIPRPIKKNSEKKKNNIDKKEQRSIRNAIVNSNFKLSLQFCNHYPNFDEGA